MRKVLGLIFILSSQYSLAGVNYECSGKATIASKPSAVPNARLDSKVLPGAVKTKIIVNEITCSQQTVAHKFFAQAPSADFDYMIFLNPIKGVSLKKNDKLNFQVSWSCDKKCRDKKWTQISDSDVADRH